MTTRTLAHSEPSTNEMVGSFKIKNALPTRNVKQIDPFLLIHHLQPTDIQSSGNLRIPPHPHAGFEVVTYLLNGSFFHRDSKGHDVIAHGGDINWMTSGSGIVHSEGPTEEFQQAGGTVELLQIWINLPADKKQLDASFRNYPAASFPQTTADDSTIKVLIGDGSPVATHSPMFLYHVTAKAGKTVTLPVDATHSAGVYVLDGKLRILADTLQKADMGEFAINGDQLAFTAVEDASFIVFGGRPLNEKLVTYGPFVMNSFDEVQKAIQRYEAGKMGTLDS